FPRSHKPVAWPAPSTPSTPFAELVIDAADVGCYARGDHKVGPEPWVALREAHLHPHQLRQCGLSGPTIVPPYVAFRLQSAEIRKLNRRRAGEQRFLFDR